MKIKKYLVILLALVIINVNVINIKAENVDTNITFVEGNQVTNPVDPDYPSIETGEEGTGSPGPLSIDYVSSLNFGENIVISSTTKEYQTVTERPYVQVTDLRGTGAGWELTASLSGFKDSEGNPSLDGAKIIKKNGTAKSILDENMPTVESNIVLTSDESTLLVMSAGDGKGMGTWVARFYGETASTKLVVLGGTAKVGKQTATITWNLRTAP